MAWVSGEPIRSGDRWRRSTARFRWPTAIPSKRLFAFLGPAYLVSVGYMDPGNWATDLGGWCPVRLHGCSGSSCCRT